MRLIRIELVYGFATTLIFFTIIFSPTSLVIGQEVPPAIDVGPDGVLFAIGLEDSDISEFQKFDWEGINEYECTVGVDCESKNFPARIYRMSAADRWDYCGVAQVTINFNLSQTYENVFLRIVRAGSETTIVKLDDSNIYNITSKMLDSVGHAYGKWKSGFGIYDIELGSLTAGIHNIKLTVDERDIGTGRYRWDAIILLVK